MKRTRWPAIVICSALVFILLAGFGAVWAAQGSSDDPLISLSYLTKKLTPSILSQVDDKVAAQKSSLESALNGKIQQFSDELKNGSATGSVYAAVTLANGKTLKGNTGTEVVLRSGSASCVASAAPGLMDTTAGGALSNGSSLSGNHLYLVTADGWGVRASGGSATLLVRGSYTIS